MKVYTQFNKPKVSPESDGLFSVDVITFSDGCMLNIGYYSFDMEKWMFHTDTLTNMEGVEFKWIYPPKELTDENMDY
ncbi:MAG: hypothetical protein RLZZ196_974 [Bacteroidota bacterium]|jgi:hypothetical protein